MAFLDSSDAGLAELPTAKGVINLANRLLSEFNIPTRLEDVSDISAAFFVVLYESLFSDRLPGIIRQPFSKEDEIHNCQTVIDVLSSDVVRDNLSHIHGSDIISGNITSISNLLDIFQYLLEYVVNKIESDVDQNSTRLSEMCFEKQDQMQHSTETSLDFSDKLKQSKVLPTRIESERKTSLSKSPSKFDESQSASLNKNENRKAFDEHPIISHEEYFAMTHKKAPSYKLVRPPSPIKADQSQSLLGQKTVDSEFDDDTEDKFQKSGNNSFKPAQTSPQIDTLVMKNHQSIADHTNKAVDDKPLAASSLFNKLGSRTATQDPITAINTFQPSDIITTKGLPERASAAKQGNHSYDDLREMVEKTAAMTRVALMTSPMRFKDLDGFQHLKTNHNVPSSSEPVVTSSMKKDESKHVAFASYQSEVDLSDKFVYEPSRKPPHSDVQMNRLTNKWSGASTVLHKPKQTIVKATKKPQTKSLSTNKVFGSARKTLLHEDKAFKEKQDILKRFYEKDHLEFAEEVDDLIGKDKQEVQMKEEDFIKHYLKYLPKKKTEGKKGTSLNPACRKGKIESKRQKKEIASSRPTSTPNSPSSLDPDEQDLLPALMEEFPYLHLSDHTWHELWRQGLHQIEALTRSYQESLRKKTSSENQLADAAERHQLLGDIMRKQLEHSKRMHDIKEQKIQQIKVKNKMHEKRIQSARARRYYNEYQVRARAKQLKKRTKEEMVFRDLFKTALNIQKERLKDIRQYATDCRKRQETQRQNEIESLENFYQDQFQMLAERLNKERLVSGAREIAQQQMLERVKRELRKKMESEIKLYQEQMFNDDDNVHYRQKDADRIKQHLHLARYTAKV